MDASTSFFLHEGQRFIFLVKIELSELYVSYSVALASLIPNLLWQMLTFVNTPIYFVSATLYEGKSLHRSHKHKAKLDEGSNAELAAASRLSQL